MNAKQTHELARAYLQQQRAARLPGILSGIVRRVIAAELLLLAWLMVTQ